MSDNSKVKTLEELISLPEKEYEEYQESQTKTEKKDEKKEDKKPEEDGEKKQKTENELLKEENEKLKIQVKNREEFILNQEKQKNNLKKSVSDKQAEIEKLNKEYESSYIADPTKARKISKKINQLEDESNQDSKKLKELELFKDNLEFVKEIHSDIGEYVSKLAEKWRKLPENKSEESQKLIDNFESNYENVIKNPNWLIKEINTIKIEEAKNKKEKEDKGETAIQKIAKASEHSVNLGGESSSNNDSPSLTLDEIIDLNDEEYEAYIKNQKGKE